MKRLLGGPDAPRAALGPKIVAEVRALHAQSAATAPGRRRPFSRGWRSWRDAVQAERDVLRALGFDDYDSFEAVVRITAARAFERAAAVEELRRCVAVYEAQLPGNVSPASESETATA
ncbi:MAG TPA: hypothetical protein VFR41_00045 [Acidimicrobiia bacterium]|nr:hypothetical protein [Acidimicrobiia bacterium]